VFLSSDDENAVAPVAVLAEQLGFAYKSMQIDNDLRCGRNIDGRRIKGWRAE
jgi:hypothetical protein